jgi:cytochrome b561
VAETRAYGAVARWLHWLTVAALAAQFTIGYLMDGDDSSGHGRGRGRGRGAGSGHGRGRGGEDDATSSLLAAHVSLGLIILLLAAVRVAWRRATDLPPWAASLSPAQQRLATTTARVLLTMLFVIPGTGLSLVHGDDDLLWLHVTAHVVFFVALAAHVGLVLSRGLLPRMT